MVQALDDYDIQEDLPQALELLGEMNNNVKQVSDLVENMLQRVKTGELSTEYGLSFLEIKYHMLLNYLINLTYVVLRKCSGQTIERDPSIDRLIEIRTVLEKIRPIDYKLRYQIDKLVKTAVTGSTNSSDPILFKPNPNNLLSNLPDDIDDDDDDINSSADEFNNNNNDNNNSDDDISDDDNKKINNINKKKKSSIKINNGKYIPPKLTAVHYDADDTQTERTKKLMDRARKRAMTSSILQDLKDEYLDVPTEISSGSRAQAILSKAQKEKQEYEEAYLTRLPVTKAEKHMQRKLTTLGTLGDEILGDIKAYEASTSSKIGNKRKKKSTGGKKRSGKKRRFH